MFSDKEKLRKQQCMVLKRCSSAPQVGTSIDNQGRTTEQAIKEYELRVVYQELLEGVTGSVPGNRFDIDRILLRKRSKNDFKVLVVQDTMPVRVLQYEFLPKLRIGNHVRPNRVPTRIRFIFCEQPGGRECAISP